MIEGCAPWHLDMTDYRRTAMEVSPLQCHKSDSYIPLYFVPHGFEMKTFVGKTTTPTNALLLKTPQTNYKLNYGFPWDLYNSMKHTKEPQRRESEMLQIGSLALVIIWSHALIVDVWQSDSAAGVSENRSRNRFWHMIHWNLETTLWESPPIIFLLATRQHAKQIQVAHWAGPSEWSTSIQKWSRQPSHEDLRHENLAKIILFARLES